MKLWLQHDGRALDFDGAVPFGSGGEAGVYAVPGTPWAAKVYHQYLPVRGAKLRLMIDNPPEDPTARQGHVSIAWPQDILADSHGRVVGYVMPLVEQMRRLIDFYHPATRRRDCPLFNYRYLVTTGGNLATAVGALHRRNYVWGDVNESNVLSAETAMVTLVDTDSFQVTEPGIGRVYRCIVGSPLYTPREMQGVDFSAIDRRKEQDLFGLGVLLFQLLMEGTHPFQVRYLGSGDPPEPSALIAQGSFPHGSGSAMCQPPPLAPPFGMLHPPLQHLFLQCFARGHHNPGERPTAEQWRTALTEAAGLLVTCGANPSHFHWPHAVACPWCQRAAMLGGRDPFPAPTQVEAGLHLVPAPVAARSSSAITTAALHGSSAPVPWVAARPGPPQTTPSPTVAVPVQGRVPWLKLVSYPLAFALAVGLWMMFKASREQRNVHVQALPNLNSATIDKEDTRTDAADAADAADAGPEMRREIAGVENTEAAGQLGSRNAVGPGRPAVEEMRGKAITESAPQVPNHTSQADFELIPDGDFTMGDTLDGMKDAPPHKVKVSAFFVQKNLVTKTDWDGVRTWGLSHGYTDLAVGAGKATNHPVQTITWHDIVKWCNARSEKDGLTPCYTVSGVTYRTGSSDAAACNWSANGYRLPTEAEWEKAARGGLSGKRFPWGDTISQSQANYLGNRGSYTYDLGPNGYNSIGSIGGTSPATSPVGSFPANGYGLYDMAGNVFEWCWDRYGTYAAGPQTDPRGVISGTYRVYRGGRWGGYANDCRVAGRSNGVGSFENFYSIGFRLARSSVPSEAAMVKQAAEQDSLSELTAAKADKGIKATQAQPFVNPLGMKFVSAGTQGVFFCIWETRVKDFQAFVDATGYDAIKDGPNGSPAATIEMEGKRVAAKLSGGTWKDPHFPPGNAQTGEHPVVCVSSLDAEAFCAWLTKRGADQLPSGWHYRLPTDGEWSAACGSSQFPWGDRWPPGPKDGNYSGTDTWARTAPVGSFTPNRYGLFDMGGNAWELCSSWYESSMNDAKILEAVPGLRNDGGQPLRVVRGASWNRNERPILRSAFRDVSDPRGRINCYGFRVVLVGGG